jgi:protocatechuate 3,4-dioxygenase beta subunit
MTDPSSWSRRTFLRRLAIALPAPWLLAACGLATPQPAAPATTAAGAEPPEGGALEATVPVAEPATAVSEARTLPPTPACGDDDDPTPAQTEGPYYTPNTPERASLREPDMTGTPLLVTGLVLTTDCQPVARALLDFWHADDQGGYDNVGYRLRGHQFTDEAGRYRLETILPALYTGRTRHIHVKVQAPNGPVLTTQLYFPNEPANARDGIFDPALVMAMGGSSEQPEGTFDFVVQPA